MSLLAPPRTSPHNGRLLPARSTIRKFGSCVVFWLDESSCTCTEHRETKRHIRGTDGQKGERASGKGMGRERERSTFFQRVRPFVSLDSPI